MGLVQKGLLLFSTFETERHQRKERRTKEYLASNQPLTTSEGEKVKGKHPLLYGREKGRTDDKRSKSLEARPATRAKIPCLW